jgi:very-short-patch-repair endonuclease
MGYFCQLPLKKRHAINIARLRKAATATELRFRDFLASLGVPYRFQQGFYNPYYRIVDFYLPEHRLVIEIDGPSHQDPDRGRRLDERFERVRGVKILRLTNEQVYIGDFGSVDDFLYGPGMVVLQGFDVLVCIAEG